MNFDRAAALYVYAGDYHGGQWSRLYAAQCKAGRNLRLNDSAYAHIRYGGSWRKVGAQRWRWVEGEWPEAHAMYRKYVAARLGQ